MYYNIISKDDFDEHVDRMAGNIVEHLEIVDEEYAYYISYDHYISNPDNIIERHVEKDLNYLWTTGIDIIDQINDLSWIYGLIIRRVSLYDIIPLVARMTNLKELHIYEALPSRVDVPLVLKNITHFSCHDHDVNARFDTSLSRESLIYLSVVGYYQEYNGPMKSLNLPRLSNVRYLKIPRVEYHASLLRSMKLSHLDISHHRDDINVAAKNLRRNDIELLSDVRTLKLGATTVTTITRLGSLKKLVHLEYEVIGVVKYINIEHMDRLAVLNVKILTKKTTDSQFKIATDNPLYNTLRILEIKAQHPCELLYEGIEFSRFTNLRSLMIDMPKGFVLDEMMEMVDSSTRDLQPCDYANVFHIDD